MACAFPSSALFIPIRRTAKRRFVSFAFFNRSREHIQLTIAEAESAAAAGA